MSMISIGAWTKSWAENKESLKVWYEPEAESTNKVAKEFAWPKDHGESYLFVTDHQTAGHGRGGSVWEDGQPGDYLLSSWAFQVRANPQPIASPLIGLAIYRAMGKSWPDLQWSLKAPNDLYLGDKKVCGVLVENVSHGDLNRFVVGIGLNVASHPVDVVQAGHLSGEITQTLWSNFLDSLWDELKTVVDDLGKTEMSVACCEALLGGLNRWPALGEQYSEVRTNGDLVTPTQTLNWHDL